MSKSLRSRYLHRLASRSAKARQSLGNAPTMNPGRCLWAGMKQTFGLLRVVLSVAIMVVRILSIIAAVIAFTMMMVPVPVATGHWQKRHRANQPNNNFLIQILLLQLPSGRPRQPEGHNPTTSGAS